MADEKTFTGLSQPSPVDAEGYQKPPIIQQLTVRPVHRQSQDIEKWRNAMRAAEASVPRRTDLYNLYDEIMLDGHLRSVIEKRIMAVTNADWTFLDQAGQEVDVMAEFIDSPEFELLITEIMQSKMWGYSMIEFDFHKDGSIGIFNIPRKHIRPERGLVAFEQTGDIGTDIRTGIYSETVLEVGGEKELGLLLVAAQYVIYKRGNFGDWAQFIEVFGQPMIDAVWDGFDESQRILLQEALDNAGGGSKIVRPAGTQLQFVQGGTNNPTGQLNELFNAACNAELSKLILGQTETTESSASSGYAQASQHGQTEDDINRTDIAFARRILNRRVCAILKANGMPVDGEFTVRADVNSGLSLEQQLNVDRTLINDLLLPISDDELYERYGRTRPDNYEELKAVLIQRKESQVYRGFGAIGIEKAMEIGEAQKQSLSDPFLTAPQANGAKTISLRELYEDCDCGCKDHDHTIKLASDDLPDDGFIDRIFRGELKDGQIDKDYYERVGKKLTDAVLQGLGKLDKADSAKAKLFERLRENVMAFSAAKSLVAMQEMNKQLRDEKGDDRSYAEFRRAVTKTDQEFNDLFLQAEYNSAKGMAQMADKWDSLQQYDYLEYRTVGDDRVRKEHEALDGIILERADPLWNTIYPPNGWGCRCTVIPSNAKAPVGRERADKVKGSGLIKPYFRRNIGTEQVVFKDDHPYFQRATNGKPRQFMAEESYAMRPAEAIVANPELPKLKVAESIDEAKRMWNDAKKSFKAADGIELELSDRWDHVIEHHEKDERWKFINEAQALIESPDEVWSTRDESNGTQLYKRYVKYYKGEPVIFSYPVDRPDKWTMWKPDQKNLRANIRKGSLIYRK